jgi:hypothetical protein
MNKAIERIVKPACMSYTPTAASATAISIGHILRDTSNSMDANNALLSQSGQSPRGPMISIPESFAAQ